MGDPYTSVPVTNYNANPPADDGSQVESNRIKWATIKTKLADTLKTAIEAINTNIGSAFGKVVGGAGITSVASNYQVLSTDQGKLVRATSGGITITTPDATDVGAPFVWRYLNNGDSDITIDGSGSQTIDGAASITVPPGAGGTLSTDGSNWYTDGQNASRTQVSPQCYLTLIPISSNALSPIPASDQSAKTAVYLRPFKGNLLPISNGTTFTTREFTELTLTLNSNHTASAIYDVFVFDNSGTLTIGTGPAWNTATTGAGARGTGSGTTELAILKGLHVNAVSMTARNGSTTYTVDEKNGLYVGSLFIDGSNGQITCHVSYGQSRKWGVWNTYNRRPVTLRVTDTTASWSPGLTVVRPSNNSTANSLTVFVGLPDVEVDIKFSQRVSGSDAASIGIGVNSTTAYSGLVASTVSSTTTNPPQTARYTMVPASIGKNTITCLEQTVGSSPTYFGGEDDMLMQAKYDA